MTIPVQIPEAALCSSCLCGWVFPLVLSPQAAVAVPPRQAVLLFLHWPDCCRVVTRGFLGMAPGTARSQRRGRGAFALSLDSCTSFGTCHAWTPQVAEAGANSSNPRKALSSLWL